MAASGSIAILGGGLAGLSTAWHLKEAGHDDYRLFEKESSLGGLCRSHVVDGFTFDYTGHLLHFRDEYAKSLALQWLGGNIRRVERNSWIFSKNVYTRYPFQTNTFGLPPHVVKECIMGFVEAQCAGSRPAQGPQDTATEDETFESWVYRNFGAGIAKHFMLPYNEKLWTVHPRELTTDWLERFVPQASLEDVLDGALEDRPTGVGYNAHFYYPMQGGIAALTQAAAPSLENVQLGQEVVGIDLGEKRVTLADGQSFLYDKVVSTIPLPQLVRLTTPLPPEVETAAGLLRYSSVLNINLGIDREVTDKHWVYFPEPEYAFYRVGFPSNFSPYNAPRGCSSFYVEIAYSDSRPIDRRLLSERVRADLIRAKLLQPTDRVVAEISLDIPCAYVTHDESRRRSLATIRRALEDNGVYSIGRYGAWEYSGMEDAILHGRKVVQELLAGPARHPGGASSQEGRTLSIVIPIHNEEAILESATTQILAAADGLNSDYELLLCENGSTDGTPAIADALSETNPHVRVLHCPEPNYGKALRLGILASCHDLVICFEIDYWDADFMSIAQATLKKYDVVVGSKRAFGARDQRPLIRRMITLAFNVFLRLVFGFGGTDTHGIKAFRRDKVRDIVRECQTEKDIFATELVLRLERAGLYMCELPLEIEEKRDPSIRLLRRVPGSVRNLARLWRIIGRRRRPARSE